jgi:hypothetical protein
MIVGPIMVTPMPWTIGLKAPSLAISCCSTRAWALVRPPPPYLAGQVGVPQPLAPMACFQASRSPSNSAASEAAIAAPALPRSEAGKFCSSQPRASARKPSSSTSPDESAMSLPRRRAARDALRPFAGRP